MSFLMLGIFWVGQQTQLNHLARSDRDLTWFHIAFLFAVTITPFSTMLLAGYPHYRVALLAYWSIFCCWGAVLYGHWGCAIRKGLLKDNIPAETHTALCRRIKIAQSLYALGALLCIISTYWSIALILLVQLNDAIAPRIPRRR
jgi:uncharacterized membrane protein